MSSKKTTEAPKTFVFIILLCLSLFTFYIIYTKKNCPVCECIPKEST